MFVFAPSVVEVTFATAFVKFNVKVPVAGVDGVLAISKVNVPADFTSYAAQFQGKKGGKFKDFVDALTLWVKRKGIK